MKNFSLFFLAVIVSCTSMCMKNDIDAEQEGVKRLRSISFEELLKLKQEEQKRVKKEVRDEQYYQTCLKSWQQVAQKFDVTLVNYAGYVLFINRTLMCGKHTSTTIKDLDNICIKFCNNAMKQRTKEGRIKAITVFNKKCKELQTQLAKHYKVHLMPNDKDIPSIIERLLQQTKKDKKLGSALASFKIKKRTDRIQIGNGGYAPLMALYPNASKKSAQYVLDEVYKLFKDMPGVDLTPSYNEKVTSLIYFAQGDRDFKDDKFARYYEKERIYYRSTFEDGEKKDYHLINPLCSRQDPSSNSGHSAQTKEECDVS